MTSIFAGVSAKTGTDVMLAAIAIETPKIIDENGFIRISLLEFFE